MNLRSRAKVRKWVLYGEVTVCVGPLYASYLAKALDTLDSLTVVMVDDRDKSLATSQYDCATGRFDDGPIQRIVWTDAFTRNGAKFNKGAALNEGIASAQPTDWILAFDGDILPPPDWRKIVEQRAERGCLHSARRYDLGSPIPTDRSWEPRGYFQLWHASDCRRSPPFSDAFPDASGYDTEFAAQWPKENWRELPIRLTHLGEKAKHWCGPNATPQENAVAVAAALRRRKSVAAQL